MTRKELIKVLATLKEKVAMADSNEITDYARYEVYIDIESAIDHLTENEEREDW